MEAREGCDLSLTRLITDKFTIDSAGKTGDARRRESSDRKYFSRMVPQTLSFDGPNVFSRTESPGAAPDRRPGRRGVDKENFDPKFARSQPKMDLGGFNLSMEEDSCIFGAEIENKLKRKMSEIDVPAKKTPSKFSIVRNNLSPYSLPAKKFELPDDRAGSPFESPFLKRTNFTLNRRVGSEARKPSQEASFDLSDAVGTSAESNEAVAPGGARSSFDYESDFGFDSLQDLDEELANRNVEPTCAKYEIISTDSPDICSASGKVGTIIARNFQFGSPIDRFGDCEASENFNEPKVPRKFPARSETTRMLNFDSDTPVSNFKFLPPNILSFKKTEPQRTSPVAEASKKSYDFFSLLSKTGSSPPNTPSEISPTAKSIKNLANNDFSTIKKFRTDSGIGGESLSPFVSPLRHYDQEDNSEDNKQTDRRRKMFMNKNPSRFIDYLSTSSLESGCISEMEEGIFDSEEPNLENFCEDVSKVPTSFQALITGEIKNHIDNTPVKTEQNLYSQINNFGRPVLRRCLSLQTEECKVERARAALFQSPGRARKRSEMDTEVVVLSKRPRNQGLQCISETQISRPILQRTLSDNEASIKMALSSSDSDLIGDFSKPFCLPLEDSQHQDLKAISGDTLASLIDGAFKDSVDSFQVIDCRYPYEYEGGHIVGAKNLFTEELVQNHLLSSENMQLMNSANRNILVFHCEFSFERGPKLCRFLRRADRALNKDSYPTLVHPELYVLRGGYRNFHSSYANHCRPVAGGYVPMSDPRHATALKRHRSNGSRKNL